MCGKNRQKIQRFQILNRPKNKKAISDISGVLRNFIWFNKLTLGIEQCSYIAWMFVNFVLQDSIYLLCYSMLF